MAKMLEYPDISCERVYARVCFSKTIANCRNVMCNFRMCAIQSRQPHQSRTDTAVTAELSKPLFWRDSYPSIYEAWLQYLLYFLIFFSNTSSRNPTKMPVKNILVFESQGTLLDAARLFTVTWNLLDWFLPVPGWSQGAGLEKAMSVGPSRLSQGPPRVTPICTKFNGGV